MHAGTYAPSKGDGYLYAPLKGQKKDMIDTLVKNWYKNQDIPQQKVQALVWGIIAKSSFKNMSPDMKKTLGKSAAKGAAATAAKEVGRGLLRGLFRK